MLWLYYFSHATVYVTILSCMKKPRITFIILCLLSLSTAFAQIRPNNPDHLYSRIQLQADFKQLRYQLEQKHINLHLYTPKPQLDRFFDSLYNSIDTPLTGLQFYALITSLSSVIKNGHSYVLPAEADRNYYNKQAAFLPLHITFADGRMYADMNCRRDTTLHDGDEILAINNTPASTITQTMLIRQVRDGNNSTYPAWILNNWLGNITVTHTDTRQHTPYTTKQAQVEQPVLL